MVLIAIMIPSYTHNEYTYYTKHPLGDLKTRMILQQIYKTHVRTHVTDNT